MNFFKEVRRRKVFQVATVYAVMAWLTIQVVDVVADPLNLPDWLDTVVIILLAVGFPIALVVAWAFELTPGGVERDADTHATNVEPKLSSQGLTIAIQALVLVAVGLLVLDQYLFSSRDSFTQAPQSVRRFSIELPWQSMPNWGDFRVRISPQGTHLAYPGSDANRTTIKLRPLDSLDATTLVSPSADPWNLAFSPDGERLAFFKYGTRLHTVSILGGQPQEIYEGESSFGLTWAGDKILIGAVGGLVSVSPVDGSSAIIPGASSSDLYASPVALPGGKRAFVSIIRTGEEPRLAVVNLEDSVTTLLPIQGEEAVYSPTGHIIFRQGTALIAVPFDLDTMRVGQQPREMAKGVASGPRLSGDGTLVYVAERVDGTAGLYWVDRQGLEVPVGAERRDYTHIDLSPEGRSVLLNTENAEIFNYDVTRGTLNLVVAPGGFPLWHPIDQLATFRRGLAIFQNGVDGGSRRYQTLGVNGIPTSWSPDGNNLAFFSDRLGDSDIWILPRDGEPYAFLDGPANERTGRFSPDGKAFAYVSDEVAGEFQVYVTSFPDSARRIPVSINGGLSPIWSEDGSELFFRHGSKVMAASISLGAEIDVSAPYELFDGPYTVDLSGHQRYDVTPDGRFLMVENSEDFRVVLVENVFEELERIVPQN